MKKNCIERYGEKVRKRKQSNLKVVEKYWKLPATERLHYDSIGRDIENSSYNPFIFSFTILKIVVILPLFLIFIGFMTGTIEQMFENSSQIIVSLLDILPIIMGIDVLYIIALIISRNWQTNELNKRFKLIK